MNVATCVWTDESLRLKPFNPYFPFELSSKDTFGELDNWLSTIYSLFLKQLG